MATPPRGALPWLRAEAARWQADGVISPEQARAILARYPAGEPARHRSATVFTILGAILVGLGAILFIAANWQSMPAAVKLALIFGSILTSHGLGWWLWLHRQSAPRVGQALVLLGTLLYGAGIWLVAQIFHLNSHWPNGFLLWALGALPVAWAAGSRPNLALGTLLLGIWTISEQMSFAQMNWLLLPILAAAGALAYHLRAPESLLLGAGALAAWQTANVIHWIERLNEAGAIAVFSALALLGLVYFAVATWHEADEDLRPLAWPYQLAGMLAGVGGLYAQTFRWMAQSTAAFPAQAWALVGLLGAAGVAGAALAVRRRGRPALPVTVAVVALAVVLPLTMAWLQTGTLRIVLFNTLMLGAVAGLVAQGYRQQSELLVNLALVAFVVQVISRYFDFFYSMMNRSLFFVVGGLILLAGGFLLERARRLLFGDSEDEKGVSL